MILKYSSSVIVFTSLGIKNSYAFLNLVYVSNEINIIIEERKQNNLKILVRIVKYFVHLFLYYKTSMFSFLLRVY